MGQRIESYSFATSRSRGCAAIKDGFIFKGNCHAFGVEGDDTAGVAELTHGEEGSGVQGRYNVHATGS